MRLALLFYAEWWWHRFDQPLGNTVWLVFKVFCLFCQCMCNHNCRWTYIRNVKQNVTTDWVAFASEWYSGCLGASKVLPLRTCSLRMNWEDQINVHSFLLCIVCWISLGFCRLWVPMNFVGKFLHLMLTLIVFMDPHKRTLKCILLLVIFKLHQNRPVC